MKGWDGSPVISFDEWFLQMAFLAAQRSKCRSRKTGAVLVQERHVIAIGYNGPPKDIFPCSTCVRQATEGYQSGLYPDGACCPSVHGEQNTILQAAYHGHPTKDATIYCTTHPCHDCAKQIINAGVVKVIYAEDYDNQLAKDLFKEVSMVTKQVEVSHG